MQKKLIAIEGFDRAGKDTLMNDLKDIKSSLSENVYLYFNDLPEDMPSYSKQPVEYLVWLDSFIDKQVKELNELFMKYDIVIMVRFYVTDFVYSYMFNRPGTVSRYLSKLDENVEISNYCLLFENYQEYIGRLKMLEGDEFIPQYDENDFNKINEKYVEAINMFEDGYLGSKIKYIKSSTTRKEIIDDFISSYPPISHQTNQLFAKINYSNKIFKAIMNDVNFKKLDNIYSNGGKLPNIILSGVGKNWYICEKVVKTYLSLGIHAEALDCVHALHGDLGMLKGDDPKLLIFVSKSGTTKELVKLVEIVDELRKKNILKNLFVVGFYLNNIENISTKDMYDILITLPNGFRYEDVPEFDNRNIVPTLSINTMQMVLDYFGIHMYESRPELVNGYVYNHLGGNNGKRLNSDKFVKNL